MMAERTPAAAEDIVRRFFRLARSGRLDDLMSLFQHGAIVYESLSSAGALSDRQGIESFLKVALVDKGHMLASAEIKKGSGGRISAAVTLEKRARAKSVFTFDVNLETAKIARLEVRFLPAIYSSITGPSERKRV